MAYILNFISETGFYLPEKGVTCEESNRLYVSDLRTCQSAASILRSVNPSIEFTESSRSHNDEAYCTVNGDTEIDYKKGDLGWKQQICLSGRHEINKIN